MATSVKPHFCVALFVLCWAASLSSAHEFRPGHLRLIEVEETAARFHVIWKKPLLTNTNLELVPSFSKVCKFTEVKPPLLGNVALTYYWRTDCDLSKTSIGIEGLPYSHTDVLVSLVRLDGERSRYVLRPGEPSVDLLEKALPSLDYFLIGVEHLVFGIDHVLFVIGLFLFISSPLALIKTITAFTFAHSVTLALSVLEIVKLDQQATEAIIALSIFFLARELVQEESKRSRLTLGRPWVMALIFGLLHGLGFAGALADIGLPDEDLWLSLLLFNIGIEAGQLGVIALLSIAAWVLSRFSMQSLFYRSAGWVMGCLATFWTIDRTVLLF